MKINNAGFEIIWNWNFRNLRKPKIFLSLFKLRVNRCRYVRGVSPGGLTDRVASDQHLNYLAHKINYTKQIAEENSGKGRLGEFKKGKTGRISEHAKEKKKRSTLQSQAKSHEQGKKRFPRSSDSRFGAQ
jgi:hypothetical protein